MPEDTVPPWDGADNGAGGRYLAQLAQLRGQPSFNLHKIRQVMNILGNPQDKICVVHVGGTNGKGSVSAGIASVLGCSGGRVGMNISPHLRRMNERVVIDGLSVSDDWISTFASHVERASESAGVALSFHEAITAVSYLGFYESNLDWAVMEVGLGGRLDASNVVASPRVAAVVSVDFDHEHILGRTIVEIAREKAGIIKAGVSVVSGLLGTSALAVLDEVSREKGSSHFHLGRDFHVSPQSQIYAFRSPLGNLALRPSLLGEHQSRNMSVVAMMAQILELNDAKIEEGIRSVFWPGRLESLVKNGGHYLLDCAHNPAGARELAIFIRNHYGRLPIAFGALETKNWPVMVEILSEVAESWYLLRPDAPLAVDNKLIKAQLSGLGISSTDLGDDYAAIFSEDFRQITSPSKPLLIAGSMYLLSKVLEQANGPLKPIWTRGVE